MAKIAKTTLCWLALLALGALSFWAGRAQACTNSCFTLPGGLCIYSGTTGQILSPNTTCPLKIWSSGGGSAGNCNGTRTCGAMTCVGAGTYCRAPGSGEYSFMENAGNGCGSCSGSTTFSGCNTCS